MGKFKKPLLPLLLMVFGLSCAVPTVAWFINDVTIAEESITGGSVFNYYARGKGTEDDPFILTKPKHVYNLAWLQNRGVYTNKTYFKLGNDIDMAGYLNGTTSESGAIPPIGTTSNPFVGDFDGDGYTISNLWVSSDFNDWKEKPKESNVSIGTDIGFFGAMSATGTGSSRIIGHATNFFLENIEVTCHVDSNRVCVVCGYLNGNLTNVGVKNGKISLKGCSNSYSRFSTVGISSADVDISEVPVGDGEGGDLVINPTKNDPTNISPVVSGGSYKQVPNSLDGKAYYVNSYSCSTPSPNHHDIHKYNSVINFSSTANLTSFKSTNSTMTTVTDESQIDSECYSAIMSTSKKIVQFSARPSFPYTITSANPYPMNTVWFDPINGGTCAIAFCITNNNKTRSMSLYRLTKDGNQYKVNKEIIFEFTKNGAAGNGGNVYYEIQLTKADVKNYSFAIGISSSSSTGAFGFACLKLAGANIEGGGDVDETGMILDKVDFVENTNITDWSNYTVHKSNLSFDISLATTASMFYNAKSDGNIYYASNPTNLVVEKISTDNESSEVAYSTTEFPNRVATKSQ